MKEKENCTRDTCQYPQNTELPFKEQNKAQPNQKRQEHKPAIHKQGKMQVQTLDKMSEKL